ncbi:MAG: hypothetical protein M3044_02270 [Thermoproteota archaeon]|nr:hypothetical protein [Thermoproteota archaeon]
MPYRNKDRTPAVIQKDFTSSPVFHTTFIMALTKNNFGIQPLTKISTSHSELMEWNDPIKIWELL